MPHTHDEPPSLNIKGENFDSGVMMNSHDRETRPIIERANLWLALIAHKILRINFLKIWYHKTATRRQLPPASFSALSIKCAYPSSCVYYKTQLQAAWYWFLFLFSKRIRIVIEKNPVANPGWYRRIVELIGREDFYNKWFFGIFQTSPDVIFIDVVYRKEKW